MPHFFYFSSPFSPPDGLIGENDIIRSYIIIVASNILILVCRLIFLFFQTFFNSEKNTQGLGYSPFTIFTAPTIATNYRVH